MADATCTAAAECKREGCTHTEGSALGHDMADATCTAAAKCKREGCTHTEGEPLGHAWDAGNVTKEPTCTAKGERTFTCKHNPSHTTMEEVAIVEDAHDWDDGEITTLATCTEKGEMKFTCKHDSSHTKTEDVAIVDDAHEWDEGVVTKQPTCTEKGEKKFTCQHDASHTKTEDIAIDPDAHDWDAGVVAKEPTCTGSGVTIYTCSINSDHQYTEVIPALGHALSDVVVSEPTAEKLGEEHSACSRCDYDIFSHYTLKEGTSPTMYPDGTRISEASSTPKATKTFDLNGQEIEILLQDPLGVLGSGELGLSVEQIELPADFDGDVDVEHAHSYEIVPTVGGVKRSGKLSNKVRLLYKIPQGWDRADLEVFLAQAGEDREFDEVIEKIGADEYLVVWTDHFSPYVFVDKLNPEEKAELEKLQNSEDSDDNANNPQDGAVITTDSPADESGNGQSNGNNSAKTGDASGEILMFSTLAMIVTGLYLGLRLKKRKSF